MKQLYAICLIILSSAVIIYGIIKWQSNQQDSSVFIDNEMTPDFVAEQLKSHIYNDKGKLSHAINADRMEHYNNLALTYFELPHYTLYPKNEQLPWQISAIEATLNHNNRVILKHRVLLKSNNEDSLIQEIHGKNFQLDLNTNIVSSDQTIMVIGKDFTMYGSGLIVDLNTTQMTLTEHVQTIYKKNAS